MTKETKAYWVDANGSNWCKACGAPVTTTVCQYCSSVVAPKLPNDADNSDQATKPAINITIENSNVQESTKTVNGGCAYTVALLVMVTTFVGLIVNMSAARYPYAVACACGLVGTYVVIKKIAESNGDIPPPNKDA